MINQLLLICTVVIIYEFLRFVKLINTIKSNLAICKKILNLFKLKKVSDYRKEKLILNYSKSLFLLSIKILIIMFSILIIIFIINLLSETYFKFLISILGLLELSIIFVIYYFIRKKNYAKL